MVTSVHLPGSRQSSFVLQELLQDEGGRWTHLNKLLNRRIIERERLTYCNRHRVRPRQGIQLAQYPVSRIPLSRLYPFIPYPVSHYPVSRIPYPVSHIPYPV